MADLSNKKVRFPRPLKRISVSWCGGTPVSAGQADEAERAALEKGRFEVRAELAEQVSALQEQVSQRLEDVLQTLQQRHQKLLEKISERIPKLVVMAASKIISGLELEPGQVESIVDSIDFSQIIPSIIQSYEGIIVQQKNEETDAFSQKPGDNLSLKFSGLEISAEKSA